MFSFNTCKFKPQDFYSEIPKGTEETASIAPILDQSFTFLGEGSQTYAFVSEDGAYVLKLFKAKHKKPFKLSRFFKNLTRGKKELEQKREKWKWKFQNTCRRYKMALVDLKEETGLIYLHFQQSPTPLYVECVAGKPLFLNLSNYPFILQKRAILAPEYCRAHPSEGKEALRLFFKERLEKGYSDPRQSLSINYGFLDGKPIQIDVGKIEPFDGDKEQELAKIYAHIDDWYSTL
jgi:hypothetical protein